MVICDKETKQFLLLKSS